MIGRLRTKVDLRFGDRKEIASSRGIRCELRYSGKRRVSGLLKLGRDRRVVAATKLRRKKS